MKPFALALGLRTQFLVAGCSSALGRHQMGNVRGVSASAGFFLPLSTCSAFAKVPNSEMEGGGGFGRGTLQPGTARSRSARPPRPGFAISSPLPRPPSPPAVPLRSGRAAARDAGTAPL